MNQSETESGRSHALPADPASIGIIRERTTNERLALMLEAAGTLIQNQNPYDYLQSMYARLAALIGIEVYFHYATGHGPRLRLAAWGGVEPQTAASLEWLDYGEAVCGLVAQTQQREFVADVQHAQNDRTSLIRGLGITAYACFPLVAHGLLLGTLSFGTRRQRAFADDEFLLMQAIANFAAAAIERHRAEAERQRLNESEAAARRELRLLSSARDAIMLRSLDGEITFWNPGAERLYGWPAAEAVGRKFSELLFDARSTLPEEVQAQVFANGEWSGELRKLTRDGRTVHVESHCSLLRDDDGTASSILVIDTDITQKKELQRQLLHAHRMQSIGTIAGGIAHDLNNLLMPILTRASALRRQPARVPPVDPNDAETVRSLTQRLVQLQEEERRHLASELHDELGQILTGLKLLVDSARRKLGADRYPEIEEAGQLIDGMLARVRDISVELRPPMLDDVGIVPTIEWHATRFGSQVGIEIDVASIGPSRRFHPEMELAIFRIVQEAITNVARHAPGARVAVTIAFADEELAVTVEDDGPGFDAGASLLQSGGVSGMRERTRIHGGSLTIRSAPGEGTLIVARFPITPDASRGS
jgi:PAS domain S-box-containing protein